MFARGTVKGPAPAVTGPEVMQALLNVHALLSPATSRPARKVFRYLDTWLRSVAKLVKKPRLAGDDVVGAGAFPSATELFAALQAKRKTEESAAKRTAYIADHVYGLISRTLGPSGLRHVVESDIMKRAREALLRVARAPGEIWSWGNIIAFGLLLVGITYLRRR